MSSSKQPFKKMVFTSIWCNYKSFFIANATTTLMEVILINGEKVQIGNRFNYLWITFNNRMCFILIYNAINF
jgi:hypothetical protein